MHPSRLHESGNSLLFMGYESRQVRGVPVAKATASRLPHVWVENVTKRVKTEVAEFHLYTKTSNSLNKQFDTMFPEIYRCDKVKEPRLSLEYVNAEDRVKTRLEFADDGSGRALKAPMELASGKKKRKKKTKRRLRPVEGDDADPPDVQTLRFRRGNPNLSFPVVAPPAQNANTLDTIDWLKSGARGGADPEFFANLPKLASKQRKKNRHMPRIKNKKQRARLTADVVALEVSER